MYIYIFSDYRNVNVSYYSRLSCSTTPDGSTAGLINVIGLYARIDNNIFLVVLVKNGIMDTSEILYLSADLSLCILFL